MAKAKSTPPACTKCGLHSRRVDHFGELDELCEACETARLDEINRVYQHSEQHPDECCCQTFLGRHCCMAPIHGDKWQVNGIDNGERFCFFIRAKDRKEAMEVGTEACLDNGEECIGVTRVRNTAA